jgi:hypothetical protein
MATSKRSSEFVRSHGSKTPSTNTRTTTFSNFIQFYYNSPISSDSYDLREDLHLTRCLTTSVMILVTPVIITELFYGESKPYSQI